MTVEILVACFSGLVLVGGALLCLLAAVGVLRFPDVFTRLHAATKAGVVGSGLVLIGVAVQDGTVATWVKVAVAVLFLVATTPVAGHVLGRAAYLSGVAPWSGTGADHLAAVLRRGRFEVGPMVLPQPDEACVDRVVLALAQGPHLESGIEQAIELARARGAELVGIALIDAAALENVGAVPMGANWHAKQLRTRRLSLARQAAAEAIQRFEEAAEASADLVWSVRLEEGSPADILEGVGGETSLLVMADGGWFDQGVLGIQDVERRLARAGLRATVHVLR